MNDTVKQSRESDKQRCYNGSWGVS